MANESERTNELLEKILAVQLHMAGATQDQVARTIKKSKQWVNALLKDIPRRPKKSDQ